MPHSKSNFSEMRSSRRTRTKEKSSTSTTQSSRNGAGASDLIGNLVARFLGGPRLSKKPDGSQMKTSGTRRSAKKVATWLEEYDDFEDHRDKRYRYDLPATVTDV
jgi:hypothetical protein